MFGFWGIFTANSQIAVGQWRDHFAFSDIVSITEDNDKTIIVASPNAIVFKYDDGSYSKLSKANGLSDVGISVIKYFENSNSLLICYENGNIDIFNGENVVNISDIKRKNVSGDKKIYSITISEENKDIAYLSAGFGIVKLNVANAEIMDTYYIGDNAAIIPVYDCVISVDTIFAATDNGIYKASKNDFLSDYNNWQLIGSQDFTSVADVAVLDGELNVVAKNLSGEYRLFYRDENFLWNQTGETLKSSTRLFVYSNDIYAVTGYLIYKFTNHTQAQKITNYNGDYIIRPKMVFYDKQNQMYIADGMHGLVYQTEKNKYGFYTVPGLFVNDNILTSSTENFTIVTAGGHGASGINLWRSARLSIFTNQQWYNVYDKDMRDYYAILLDENKKGHFFIGAWGYGIAEYQDTLKIAVYNQDNSPLESLLDGPYIRISGLAFDSEHNLWVLNQAYNNPLNVKKPDGSWVSFSLNGLVSNTTTEQILVTKDDNIWGVLPKLGIFAFDYNQTLENTSDDIVKVFYPIDEEGEKIGLSVLCLAEDKDGALWLGTDQGVGVFYSPADFNDDNFRATRIKITAYLNDSLVTNYLLNEQIVQCITIDGGNRKWFGTANSGAYLMNDNGTKELLHFTTENSPLPSNNVLSISIEPITGEVFFVTSTGVVSYRGDATEADNQFGNVYVFPNPVRHDYNGTITITGLAADVNVKITDVAGNIVYETTANGGQATWDGNNFSGRRVATGVYLVFCSNDDGSETFVTKLLFIN